MSSNLLKVNENSHSFDGAHAPAQRILIVGRDPFSSDLLATAIGRNPRWSAISVPASSLLKVVAKGEPALAVISADLSTLPSHGFALASALSRASPEMPIILLLAEVSREAVIRAFQSGAIGVFCQEEPISDLLHCIERVSNGSIWAGKKVTATLLETFKTIPSSGALTGIESASLTPRELQVIQCAATGKTNKSIATQLRLSEHTVKNYMFRAFSKLGISSRVELLFYLALRGHAVDPSGNGHSPVPGTEEPVREGTDRFRTNAPIVPKLAVDQNDMES